MTDFTARNHGSVWTISAVSPAAIKFAEQNFDVPDWAGSPTHFTTDHRPARNLIEQLIDEGWKVR